MPWLGILVAPLAQLENIHQLLDTVLVPIVWLELSLLPRLLPAPTAVLVPTLQHHRALHVLLVPVVSTPAVMQQALALLVPLAPIVLPLVRLVVLIVEQALIRPVAPPSAQTVLLGSMRALLVALVVLIVLLGSTQVLLQALVAIVLLATMRVLLVPLAVLVVRLVLTLPLRQALAQTVLQEPTLGSLRAVLVRVVL
jgi:hypothetical protein